MGRLQGQSRFRALALAWPSSAVARILLVPVALLGAGISMALSFVVVLPAALVVQLAVLARERVLTVPSVVLPGMRATLTRDYLVWGAYAWIIFSDGIWARLLLPPSDAAQYAFAVALGRQALFAATPLAIVIVPLAARQHHESRSIQPWAIAGTVTLLFAALAVGMGVHPELPARIIAGDAGLANATLLRGYVVIGTLGAACSLLMALAAGSGRMPQSRLMFTLGLAGLVVPPLLITNSTHLLWWQGGLMVALVCVLVVPLTRQSHATR